MTPVPYEWEVREFALFRYMPVAPLVACRWVSAEGRAILNKLDGLPTPAEYERNQSIQWLRREHIYRAAREGSSVAQCATMFHLSRARISQIIKEEHRKRMRRWRKSTGYMRGILSPDGYDCFMGSGAKEVAPALQGGEKQ
jgi:hypothetical protein